MNGKMKAAVLYGSYDQRLEEVDIPSITDDQVLLRIQACNVCGSDVHFWEAGRVGPFIVKEPLILGHECAGEIVEVGKNVKGLKVGTRVAVEPGVPCRKCEWCRGGRYNLCPDVQFMAVPGTNGAFCEYYAHAADYVFPIPDHVSYAEAAIAEPLSVGIHAAKRGRMTIGSSVLIAGAGMIGISTLIAARAAGTGNIIISDLIPYRLEMAEKLGATAAVNIKERDLAEEVYKLTNGAGVDTFVECSGTEKGVLSGPPLVKRGGVAVTIGLASDPIPFPVVDLLCKEVDVVGIYRYANCYPAAVALISSGKVNFNELITQHYPLDDVNTAMQMAQAKAAGTMKVSVTI